MCKAFSCLVTKSGKVYWKLGVDEHDRLWSLLKNQDKDLTERGIIRKEQRFARIEIAPQNNNYLSPDEWIFKIDESDVPEWFNDQLEKKCFKAKDEWLRQVYAQIDLKIVRNPVHPFTIKPPKKITEKHLKLLREWASVGASVYAYIGSFFPHIKTWKYAEKVNVKGYPFQASLDLWLMGLVPSFDGSKWRLHGGKNGKVLWKGTLKEAA